MKNINTHSNTIIVSDEIAEYLVKTYTDWENDEGVRSLEKVVNNIVSKIDFIIKHQDKNGKLKGFNVSFGLNKPIKYPVKLTKNIINILC